MANSIPLPLSSRDKVLVRRGMVLQWVTLVHGILESAVALTAGVAAGSVVLFGFGLDSLIEVTSAAIVIWRLAVQNNVARRVRADAYGIRFVGGCFLVLAAYISYDSVLALIRHEVPGESILGLVMAAISVVGMPLLARAKRKLAGEIQSSAMNADSVQSEFCAYLSGILLVGLGLNWCFGWWWADPSAALLMVPIIVREGFLALKGQSCGCAACLMPGPK